MYTIADGEVRLVPPLAGSSRPDPRQRALCTMDEKMTLTPREMTAEDWQPLRDVGLDDEDLLKVGHLIAIVNDFPRMADGFGLPLHPRLREAAATGVPLRRGG